MSAVKPEDLRKAYKKERDPRVKIRMAAVNMVCMNGQDVRHVADSLMQCPGWVSFWVERFREGGIDALRDLPRSGRPPKVVLEKIEGMLSDACGIITPMQLREDVRKKYGVKYHITSARRIMHRLGMSAKTVRRVHVRRAGVGEIRKWQRNAKRRISRLGSLFDPLIHPWSASYKSSSDGLDRVMPSMSPKLSMAHSNWLLYDADLTPIWER